MTVPMVRFMTTGDRVPEVEAGRGAPHVNTAYVAVTVVAIVATGFVAIADLARAGFVLDNSARVGVPQSWLTPLGLTKGAGAVGLLLGLAGVPVVGPAAALGLSAFFVGAVVTHLPSPQLRPAVPAGLPGAGGRLAGAVAGRVTGRNRRPAPRGSPPTMPGVSYPAPQPPMAGQPLVTVGDVAVTLTVQGPGTFHATQIPVSNRLQVGDVHQRVNYVRSLVAALG